MNALLLNDMFDGYIFGEGQDAASPIPRFKRDLIS